MPWDDEPPDDAYNRVTNPERFAPVLTAARGLLHRLEATYEVSREVGDRSDFGQHATDFTEVVRLVPAGDGGSLAVGFTDFPGVFVRVGHGLVEGYPSCGCDACDEQADDLVDELEEFVDAFVNGGVTETLTRHAYKHTIVHRGSGWTRLDRGEWKEIGPLGTSTWPAWPVRT